MGSIIRKMGNYKCKKIAGSDWVLMSFDFVKLEFN